MKAETFQAEGNEGNEQSINPGHYYMRVRTLGHSANFESEKGVRRAAGLGFQIRVQSNEGLNNRTS